MDRFDPASYLGFNPSMWLPQQCAKPPNVFQPPQPSQGKLRQFIQTPTSSSDPGFGVNVPDQLIVDNANPANFFLFNDDNPTSSRQDFNSSNFFPSYDETEVGQRSMLDISENMHWNQFPVATSCQSTLPPADFTLDCSLQQEDPSTQISGKLMLYPNGIVMCFFEETTQARDQRCVLCGENGSNGEGNELHKHRVAGSLVFGNSSYTLEISTVEKSEMGCQTEPEQVEAKVTTRRRKPAVTSKVKKPKEVREIEVQTVPEEPPPKPDPEPLSEVKPNVVKPKTKPKPVSEPAKRPRKLVSIFQSSSALNSSSSPSKKKKQENLEKNIKKLETQKKILIRKFMKGDGAKENMIKCESCPLAFATAEKLALHTRNVHLGFRPHMCKICGKSFHLKKILNQHVVAHQRSKPHVCKVCGAGFTRLNRLKEHSSVHSGVRPFECPFCGKGFNRKMYLMNHMRHHTGERPYKCTECDKSFIEQSNLLAHKKLHQETRQFPCKHCDKSFNRRKLWEDHVATHEGALEHQCEVCGKRFATESMKRHLLTHSEVFEFKCDVCGMQFKRKDKLTQHVKTHGGEEKAFKCEDCGKSFFRSDQLTEHLRQHEDPNLAQCPVCLKFFAKSEKFEKHVQNHSKEKKPEPPGEPQPCTICGKTLSNRWSLRVHMEKVHAVDTQRKRKAKPKPNPKPAELPVVENNPCGFVPPENPDLRTESPLDSDYSAYVQSSAPVEVPLAEIETTFSYSPQMTAEGFGLNQDDAIFANEGNTSPSQIDPSVSLTPDAFSAVAYLLAFPSYQ